MAQAAGIQPGVNSTTAEVVRAGRFELVGPDGKVLAVLGKVAKHPHDGDAVGPGVALALLDKDGQKPPQELLQVTVGMIARFLEFRPLG